MRDRPRDFIWRGFLDDLDVALQECVGDAIESGAHAAVAALRKSIPPDALEQYIDRRPLTLWVVEHVADLALARGGAGHAASPG
jgi:hypothetical protein